MGSLICFMLLALMSIIITAVVVVVVFFVVVVVLVVVVEFMLSITGATMGSLICFVLPALMTITVTMITQTRQKYQAQVCMFFVCLSVCVCLCESVCLCVCSLGCVTMLAKAEADDHRAAPCAANSVTLCPDCLRSWLRSA